jgi:hypothetical protein
MSTEPTYDDSSLGVLLSGRHSLYIGLLTLIAIIAAVIVALMR